jgi:hypothetical protein
MAFVPGGMLRHLVGHAARRLLLSYSVEMTNSLSGATMVGDLL